MTIRPQNHLGTNFCVILCSERMMVLWLRKNSKGQKAKIQHPPKCRLDGENSLEKRTSVFYYFCVLTAILEVLFNLVQLYIAPEVLARVEQKTPLWELLTTIGVFTVGAFYSCTDLKNI